MGDTTAARRARSAKAAYLRDLGTGRRSLRRAIRVPPKALKMATAYEVVLAAHNMGPAGTRKVFQLAAVAPYTELGYLTGYEQDQILKYLPKRAK